MKNTKNTLNSIFRKATLLSVLVFAVLVSCKKEEGDLGLNVQPKGDIIDANVIDTFSIQAYTVLHDSVQTSGLSRFLLGNYIDPVFGNIKTDIYTQIRLSSDNVNFIPSGGTLADIVLDSVVLALSYVDYYGTLNAQTFEVYELSNEISDSLHYSFQTIADNGINIADVSASTVIPRPDSAFRLNGETFSPQLRIKLNNSFGQKIINESGNSNLANNDNFKSFIKGLRITTNNTFGVNQGAIFYFDPKHIDTKVTLYYRDTSGSNHDTLKFNLLINENSNYFTHRNFDYFGTNVNNQLTNSSLGDNEFYFQALGGLKSIIKFPSIMSLKDSNIIINRAELVLQLDNTSSVNYPSSEQIISSSKDSTGVFSVNYNNANTVIASYLSNNSYTIFLTDYINDILRGKKSNNGIEIFPSSFGVSVNRGIVKGINSSTPPKLILTYTKYQ